jgi:predicted MFS family arabinose efflux permease
VRVLQPLRVSGFGRLLCSYTVNQLGDAVAIVALAVLVYDHTGDPLATTALFVTGKFVPAFLAPVLTARVDQLPMRRTLPALYLVEAVVFALLALQDGSDFLLVAVLLLALADGTIALAARGLSRGTIATLLDKGVLRDGNALVNLGFALATVTGMSLGGVLVSSSGPGTALAVDAASFLAVALVIASGPRFPAPPRDGHQPFRTRLREGLAHVGRNRVLRALLAWEALAFIFFTLVLPIEVVYAKKTLGTGDLGFGILMASWSFGILIGSFAFLRLRALPQGPLLLASTAAIGIAYLGMAAIPSLVPACLFSVLGGIGNGNQWVAVMTMLQERTPADLQARATGLLESVGAAMPGVGFIIGGVLTSIASPVAAYAVAGGGVMVLALAGAVVSRGSLSAAAAES